MAADSMIDAYLAAFERRLRPRRDRQDLLAEVADHLHSAAERLESLGVDRETAQRRALAQFGEPRLVASLLTAVPSKGNLMSLFLARRLTAMLAVAIVLWFGAVVTSWFGMTDLAGWNVMRYLLASTVIAAAVLVTTGALIGLNLRAVGGSDAQIGVIGVIGILSAVAAGALSWVVGLWLPLLAIAVVWTLVRAWRLCVGSRPFAIVLLIAAPLQASLAIATTASGLRFDNGMEAAIGGIIAMFAVFLIAGFVDVTVLLAPRAVHAAIA